MSTLLVNKVQNLTGSTLTLDAPIVNITGAVATFTGGSGVQVGVTAANEIDTTGGLNLVLDSSGGTVQVDDDLTVTGTIATSVFQFGVSSSNEIDTLSGNLTLDSAGGTVSVDDDLSVTGSIATSVLQFGVTGSNEIDTVSGNLTIDSAGGTVTIDDDLTVSGNLTVNGITTTVNSTTITIDDPIFTLGGDTAPASDDNKDRGIEFRWHNGSTAKVGFFGFDDSTGHLTFIPDATNSSEVFSGTQGAIDVNEYYIGGTSVLNSTTLGSGVITSSLTTVGTIGTGTWQGSTIGTAYGGTGQTSLGAVDAADFGSNDGVSDATDGYLLTADGSGGVAWEVVEISYDTSPQLGGNLDVNGNSIVSTSNGNITLSPNGTGNVVLGTLTFDADQTVGAGQDNYVLTYDHSSQTIGLEASGAGASDLVNDTTPQLGGDLDVNGNSIVSVSNASINITPNGTGNVSLGNFVFDADQTVGSGQDDYVLTYDNPSGTIRLEASSGGGGGITEAQAIAYAIAL